MAEDTITQSLRELDEASAAVDMIEATLVGTNHYARGPQPWTDQALANIRRALDEQRATWKEVEAIVLAAEAEAAAEVETEAAMDAWVDHVKDAPVATVERREGRA